VAELDQTLPRSRPKALTPLLVLVAITALLSLVYAIQYYVGGPVRLPAVSEILDLALSPDGRLLAAGLQDGTVMLWEVPGRISTAVATESDMSGREPWPARVLSAHGAPVLLVDFTGDAMLISVATDGEVVWWDAEPGEVVQRLRAGDGPFVDAALNLDGTVLAMLSEDGVATIWNLRAERQLHSIPLDEGARLVVALSSDGALLATGEGSNVQVWDVETGEPIQRLDAYCDDETMATKKECDDADEDWLGHDEEVTALAFSPDGQILASGSADTTIMFWDLETAEVESPAEGHWATVTTMVFSDDGSMLLTGGKDNKVRNIRVVGGKNSATYQGHLAGVNRALHWPVANTIISAGDDGTVRVWETTTQYTIHMEWSRHGFQPSWGRLLSVWLVISGVLGLVCLWGLRRLQIWSHLVALAMYVVGPIVVLGLPLFEVLSYPLSMDAKLRIAWPLIVLAVWYVVLDIILMREDVGEAYEAPRDATLSEQLVVSQRTAKTRFGILTFAVWVALLVTLFSVLRRFDLDVAFMAHWLPFIMGGARVTVEISAKSIILAVILALLGALGRLSKNPIFNGVSGFYISVIRGTPLMVQIFVWYLGLPRLQVVLESYVPMETIWTWLGVRLGMIEGPSVPLRILGAGVLALGVNYGAYMTEIFRAGIQAVSKGQHEAAQALGMSGAQTFRRIVLPQAFRIVIPPIGNEFIAMMKDSSLVMWMGVWELTFRAQKIGRQNFRNLETFLIAAAFYWILTVIFQFLQGKLEEYMARGERR
jgi:polar amino acid transport system permease protein